jgi:hypothetical protein
MCSFIPGWYPAGIAGERPLLSLLSAGEDFGNSSAYEFFTLPFGAEAHDRLLIAAVAGGSAGTALPTSVTIGGVAASIHAQTDNAGNTRNGHAFIASALVPAGASGNFAVNWSGTMLDMSYGLYRASGLISLTPTDTVTDAGAGPSLILDRAHQGFIIAAGSGVSASFANYPSPMIKDFETGSDGTFDTVAHTPVVFGAVTNFSAAPSSNGASPSRYAAASWA